MNEAAEFERIVREVDRVVAALDGLSAPQLDWTPGPGANSVLVLAAHTVGAAERHVIVHVGGGTPSATRDSEFATQGSAAGVRGRWSDLRPRIIATLEGLDASRLDRELPELATRPSGERSARAMLIHAVAHAAEHAGQAELTRDLAKRTAPE